MSYFIFFFITLVFAVCLSYLVKRGFGFTAALTNTFLIFLLYAFGLFARLRAGVFVFIALAALMLAVTVFLSAKKKDKGVFDILKNPVFLFYAGVGFTVGIVFINKISSDWDELSHWALVVKNMFAGGDFGNLGDSTTMFNRYVPGTGIFMYAFQIFNKKFIDGNLYAAFDVLALSFLLPFAERFGNKLSVGFFATLIISVCIPVVFKFSVYGNLLVDSLLGIAAAYIYAVYLADRGKADFFTMAEMAFAAFALCVIKSSGFALMLFGAGLVGIDVLTRNIKDLKRFFKSVPNVFGVALIVVLVVFAKVSWNVYIDKNNVRAGWNSSEMSFSAIIDWIVKPNEFQSEVTSLFIRTFFNGKFLYKFDTYLQQPQWFAVALYAVCAVAVGLKTKNALFASLQFVMTVALLFMYAASMLLLYVFDFSYTESLNLSSFQRYLQTYSVFAALVYFYTLVDVFIMPKSEKSAERAEKRYLWAVPAALFSAVCVAGCLFGQAYCKANSENVTEPYGEWIEAVEELDENDRVYYIMKDFGYYGSCVREYLRVRYFAAPVRCSGFDEGGSYADGRSAPAAYTGNPFVMADTSAEDLATELSSYDYLFIDSVDENFSAKYGALFDGAPIAKKMYKVTCVGGSVILRPVG